MATTNSRTLWANFIQGDSQVTYLVDTILKNLTSRNILWFTNGFENAISDLPTWTAFSVSINSTGSTPICPSFVCCATFVVKSEVSAVFSRICRLIVGPLSTSHMFTNSSKSHPKRSSSIKRWRDLDMFPVRDSILLHYKKLKVTMETIKPLTHNRGKMNAAHPSRVVRLRPGTAKFQSPSVSKSSNLWLPKKWDKLRSLSHRRWHSYDHIFCIYTCIHMYIYTWVAKYTRLCCTSLY